MTLAQYQTRLAEIDAACDRNPAPAKRNALNTEWTMLLNTYTARIDALCATFDAATKDMSEAEMMAEYERLQSVELDTIAL